MNLTSFQRKIAVASIIRLDEIRAGSIALPEGSRVAPLKQAAKVRCASRTSVRPYQEKR